MTSTCCCSGVSAACSVASSAVLRGGQSLLLFRQRRLGRAPALLALLQILRVGVGRGDCRRLELRHPRLGFLQVGFQLAGLLFLGEELLGRRLVLVLLLGERGLGVDDLLLLLRHPQRRLVFEVFHLRVFDLANPSSAPPRAKSSRAIKVSRSASAVASASVSSATRWSLPGELAAGLLPARPRPVPAPPQRCLGLLFGGLNRRELLRDSVFGAVALGVELGPGLQVRVLLGLERRRVWLCELLSLSTADFISRCAATSLTRFSRMWCSSARFWSSVTFACW